SHMTLDQLSDKMDSSLGNIQGVIFNYSQPIMDNVEEAVACINCDLAVKVYGDDLNQMDATADTIMNILRTVRGMEDLGVIRNMGQPELSINLNEQKMAAYGVTKADANAVIEMAIGGKAATQMYEGERKFDVRVRYEPEYRSSEEAITD